MSMTVPAKTEERRGANHYVAGSVLTGNKIAHALVRYAKALPENEKADTVAFPVLLGTGDVVTSETLIGPASQVRNVPEPNDHKEIVDEELVRALEQKTEALGVPRPKTESGDDTGQSLSYEF